jgi:hypothetical protein
MSSPIATTCCQPSIDGLRSLQQEQRRAQARTERGPGPVLLRDPVAAVRCFGRLESAWITVRAPLYSSPCDQVTHPRDGPSSGDTETNSGRESPDRILPLWSLCTIFTIARRARKPGGFVRNVASLIGTHRAFAGDVSRVARRFEANIPHHNTIGRSAPGHPPCCRTNWPCDRNSTLPRSEADSVAMVCPIGVAREVFVGRLEH